jgi:hypothetical protein
MTEMKAMETHHMTTYFPDHRKYGRRAIRHAKSLGLAIGVKYEDGEVALKASTDHLERDLMEELYACAAGYLFFYVPATRDRVGEIFFIHVNDPEESITDYTVDSRIEEIVRAAEGN